VSAAGVPRIRIAPTLTNDVALMLQLLPFSKEVASFIADPGGFVRDHRGELRFLQQLGRARVNHLRTSTTDAGVGTGGMAPDEPVRPPDPAVSSIVQGRTSLLR
jgi:hypothetical protein